MSFFFFSPSFGENLIGFWLTHLWSILSSEALFYPPPHNFPLLLWMFANTNQSTRVLEHRLMEQMTLLISILFLLSKSEKGIF